MTLYDTREGVVISDTVQMDDEIYEQPLIFMFSVFFIKENNIRHLQTLHLNYESVIIVL